MGTSPTTACSTGCPVELVRPRRRRGQRWRGRRSRSATGRASSPSGSRGRSSCGSANGRAAGPACRIPTSTAPSCPRRPPDARVCRWATRSPRLPWPNVPCASTTGSAACASTRSTPAALNARRRGPGPEAREAGSRRGGRMSCTDRASAATAPEARWSSTSKAWD